MFKPSTCPENPDRYMGTLANLEFLDLSGNQFSGNIPVELSTLTNLRELHLGRFGYQGGSHITGSIPPEFGNLTELRALSLTALGLEGSIPPELGNLTSLTSLTLDFNELSGSIPASLGNLQQLVLLRVSANDLSGRIPRELGRLSRLEDLLAGGNRLHGHVPPELGHLSSLKRMALHDNELTGSLPPELGDLGRLELLYVGENNLSGAIPLEFVDLQLSSFYWSDSRLCAPPDPAFQAWLATIRELEGGPACVADALRALYESGGGSDWTNAANWLTEEPLSEWYGVTTDEDGRVTELNLAANGLSGRIPPEIGLLADLRRLDLRDNRLTGEVPGELGKLAELRDLYLSANQFDGRLPADLGNLSELTSLYVTDNRFTGALPSSLAGLSSLADFQWNHSGLCAPTAEWYQTWLRTITTHTGGRDCSPEVRLSVIGAHVNQAVQDPAGSVPLIAGRDGLLRVMVTADQGNDYRPGGEARFFLNGQEIHRADLELRSGLGIPEDATSAHPDQSLVAAIPGEILAPAVEVVVEVDPDSVVSRAAGSVTRFPAQGRLELDVREMPPMELTVVPTLTLQNPDSSVLDWVSGLGPEHPTIKYATQVLPVGEYAVHGREPFIRAEVPTDSDSWSYFLEEIRLLRAMDGGTGYYFSVISSERPGIAGMAARFLGVGALGIGIIDFIMAHELGHAMYLFHHAPCGLGFQKDTADPNYPYLDGSIGAWGYDARAGDLVAPSTPDVMGYCFPAWISDYHFDQALTNRLELEKSPAARASTEATADGALRLLLWGGTSPNGELRLNPAFALDMPAQLPAGTGPYRLEGFGAAGAREFSLDFEMEELSHGGGHFLFAIPLEERWLDTLERIVLTGPEGTLERDGNNGEPMALVLDGETDRLRSVLRGEDAAGAATAVSAEAAGAWNTRGSDARILVSYGLPGRVPN